MNVLSSFLVFSPTAPSFFSFFSTQHWGHLIIIGFFNPNWSAPGSFDFLVCFLPPHQGYFMCFTPWSFDFFFTTTLGSIDCHTQLNSTQSWVSLIFLRNHITNHEPQNQRVSHFISTKLSMHPYFNPTRRFLGEKFRTPDLPPFQKKFLILNLTQN